MSERVQEEEFAVSGHGALRAEEKVEEEEEEEEEERLFCRFSGRGPVPHPKVELGLAAAGTKVHTAAAGTGPKAHLRPLLSPPVYYCPRQLAPTPHPANLANP